MVKGKGKQICMILALIGLLTGCGSQSKVPDDYATNEGYQTEKADAKADTETNTAETTAAAAGIAKEDIKVGVLYISDPAEGSGYSYTHDLGIQGMQENLGLSSDQIVRKIVDDSDAQATEASIRECIDEGCNVIFSTSWGYMETTAAMAEEYPDIYFSHGTGYKSNGKNFKIISAVSIRHVI